MICTDGLIETGGHDMASGWTRLRPVLEKHTGARDLEQLADALVQAVHGPSSHHTTGPLVDRREDDIALLLLRRERRPAAPVLPRPRRPPHRADRRPGRTRAHRGRPQAAARAAARLGRRGAGRLGGPDDLRDDHQRPGAHRRRRGAGRRRSRGPPGTRRLRVEVADASDELPHRRCPGEMASSGRGLILMEMLADAWGVDPQGRRQVHLVRAVRGGGGRFAGNGGVGLGWPVAGGGRAAGDAWTMGAGRPGRPGKGPAGRASPPDRPGSPRVTARVAVGPPDSRGPRRLGAYRLRSSPSTPNPAAATGTASSIPTSPATLAPAVSAIMIIAGCIWTVRLWMTGWRMCPSSCCTARTTPSVHSAIPTPAVGERDQHRDRARDEGPQVRDVGADEDERAEPDGPGHAQDQQTGGDADGVDERDDRGAAHEPLDGLEGPSRHGLHGLTPTARGQRVREVDGPVGVLEEEEGEQQREHTGGDERAEHAEPFEQPAGRAGPELGQQLLGVVGDVGHPVTAGRPEVIGHPVPGLLERGDDLVTGVDERADDDVSGAADHRDECDAGEPGGDGPPSPHADQPAVYGAQQSGAE